MMSHNSEDLTIKQKPPIAAPLDCQTTANLRNLLGSLRLGRLLAPPGRFFCLFAGRWAWFPARLEATR